MITKPWTPPPPQALEDREVLYSVDLPCLMSGAGTPFMGPAPLCWCMLQGLRMVRLQSKFEIKTESGDRLLELCDGKVWGVPMLVDMFLRQNTLSELFFEDIMAETRKTVANEQQQSDSN